MFISKRKFLLHLRLQVLSEENPNRRMKIELFLRKKFDTEITKKSLSGNQVNRKWISGKQENRGV